MSATNRFDVVYPGGLKTFFHSTDASVEEFCNSHFGSVWETAKENGASVVMNAPAEPAEPVEASAPDSGCEEAGEAAPTPEVETVEYADGTTATGTPPLPEASPAEKPKAKKSK